MTVFSSLRRLRHGSLRHLSPIWIPLGRLYRLAVARSGLSFTEAHFIGPYGPFLMSAEFAFSDFANWGTAHNRAFVRCIEACRDKTCVLDIGAHIGLVTMPMSQMLGPEGRVFAFEPSKANNATLIDHLHLNGINNVTVIDNLVGDMIHDNIVFYEHTGVSGMNTCAPVKANGDYVKTHREQTTLDAFCQRNGIWPEIIKIDVEGLELSVIDGAREVLQTIRPLLFVSVHPHHLRSLGRTPDELQSLADELNYVVTDVNGNHVHMFQLDEYIMRPRET